MNGVCEKRENPIQGPRPPPLRLGLHKESHKIRKPPIGKPNQNHPLVIYSVSPEPIFADPSNFMSIVQRLTGRTDHNSPVSPAARFASIQRTSPKEREQRETLRCDIGDDQILLGFDVDAAQMPGILSPAPANLPAISPGMFLPEPHSNLFGFTDYMMSPASLFFSGAATFLSSTPSPAADLFNIFDY